MGVDVEALRREVATFYDVDLSAVDGTFKLTTPERQGSIARYALDAALGRALGIRSRAVYTAATFGELEAALTNSAPAVSANPIRTSGGEVSCGLDLESVENMPEASDYFAHEFYAAHFTAAEIAYCASQDTPRMHFAARWCAKEAVKKCDNALLEAEMSAIEVAMDDSGAAHLRYTVEGGDPARLPYALSLTHTPDYAAAAVMRAPAPPEAPGVTPPSVLPPSPQPHWLHAIAILLALAALALAAFDLAFN